MKPHKKVIRFINRYLRDQEISQQELADRMGRKKTGVGHYLREDRKLSLENFFKIADAIEITPSNIINAALRTKESDVANVVDLGRGGFTDPDLAERIARKMLQLDRLGKLGTFENMLDLFLNDATNENGGKKKRNAR